MEGKAYRSVTTGDRGFMLERGGKTFIRLDRPSQVIERPYKKSDWIEESPHRPLLPHCVTRIYFEAEKYLLVALGDPQGRNMEWQMMQNRDKSYYRENMNDADNVLVQKLHKAMAEVLDPLSR